VAGARSVCLGWVHAGNVRAEFMDSILGVLAEPLSARLIGRYETFTAGSHIPAARNQVAAQFLAGPEAWLWMVDTDLIFLPGLLTRLAATADEHNRPLVTGLYFTTTRAGLPLVPMIYDRDPKRRPEFTPCQGWQPGSVIEVGGCGAGCLLIHRRVLESVAAAEDGPAWFDELTDDSHRTLGEDLSFCLRATWAGFPIVADTAARAGHVKPLIVGLPGTALDPLPEEAR
jgi:hypothetical protein